MKDKLTLSDGLHKILWIVKDKINTSADAQYKIFDVIRLNKFITKMVGDVKVVIPNNDFDIICNEVDEIIGSPKNYSSEDNDTNMDQEFEIPYKSQPKEETKVVYSDEIEDSDQSDVEMKVSPVKVEANTKPHEEAIPEPEDLPEIPEHEYQPEMPEPEDEYEMPPQDDEDDIYTPIKALSPMNPDWIIKARISK